MAVNTRSRLFSSQNWYQQAERIIRGQNLQALINDSNSKSFYSIDSFCSFYPIETLELHIYNINITHHPSPITQTYNIIKAIDIFIFLMIQRHIIILSTLLILSLNLCTYRIYDDSLWPNTLDNNTNQLIKIIDMSQCSEYNGIEGCCNNFNDQQQKGSYIEINSIFGFQGDGCDHCAINLKRFWCEYACSPRQADFLVVTDPNATVVDPTDPSKNVSVQKVTLTVQAQTACDLYNSCKRIGFVTSVSAMGSPAGFLNFQGHNAVDDGKQYIEVKFSQDKTKSLAFSDDFPELYRKRLSTCNKTVEIVDQQNKTGIVHGFIFHQNCTCNSCEEACDRTTGFIYTQSSVFQGFNWILVGSTYLAVGMVAALVTIKRKRDEEKKRKAF